MVTSSNAGKDKIAPILKQTPIIKDGLLSPEIMWQMGEISGIKISPDGEKILYGISYTSIEQNKTGRNLFCVNINSKKSTRLTNEDCKLINETWSRDGKYIFYLAPEGNNKETDPDEDKKNQLWRIKADGSEKKQISNYKEGIESFKLSPNGKRVLFVSTIQYGNNARKIYPDLKKADVRIIDDLMYKHWDEWIEKIPHPFLAGLTENGLENITDILKDEPYECPMRPFGGIEQIDWSPDGKTIAYTCRKKKGIEYSLSTNSNIYLYETATGVTKNITTGNYGYDTNPAFSPDGKYIAYESMEHAGYESDQNRLFIFNTKTEEKTFLSKNLDADVSNIKWAPDSKSIYFLAAEKIVIQLYNISLSGDTRQITTDMADIAGINISGSGIYVLRHSMLRPNEIYKIESESGRLTALTDENKYFYDHLKLPKVEMRMIKTTDNKEMPTWVVYPPDFDKTKKYPSILFCTGGPQGYNGQFWSLRWNLHLMAAKGYVAVLPNRRGVLGFGKEWKEQISKDYAGQNMKDYLSAADEILAEPYISNMGCAGASYGGYSVYWLAGNHNRRFKAFLSHSGILNAESQYLETEELWFENWDMGGPFWDKKNKAAQKSFKEGSPHRYIQNWDTPILCIHGEKDYRIVATQSMQAFNAAKIKGIPARLLIFPDENHWISKPQNSILWHREFFNWFDKWLK